MKGDSNLHAGMGWAKKSSRSAQCRSHTYVLQYACMHSFNYYQNDSISAHGMNIIIAAREAVTPNQAAAAFLFTN